MTKKEKLTLLIPALWASLFDTVITIVHQSKDYWSGDLKAANEANPIGAVFMKYHVAGLFILSALWMILVSVLGYYLPRKISRVFLLFVLIAHTFGGSTWLTGKYGFWCVMTFILFNSILFYVVKDSVDKDIQPQKVSGEIIR
jgi:hypothetical protein